MRHMQHQFRGRPFAKQGARPVRAVPKHLLLAAIAQSKDVRPVSVPTTVQPTQTGSFADFGLSETLVGNIRAKGYQTPTPVQLQSIPAVLAHRDIIGVANTGTGKTGAFLIPLLQKVSMDRAQRVLIVAPTRELAYQVHKELRELARNMSIKSALLIGGASQWRQEQDVRNDPHFVIATPGRLKDFVDTRTIRLSGFRNVVLDEADRMVDIGFISTIKFFLTLLPKERQSLFFSATISGKVGEIIGDFVKDPVRVSIASSSSPSLITQDVIRVKQPMSKIDTLHDLLKNTAFEKVLVFGRTKHGVQKLSDELSRRGVRSGAIHGNKRQNQRQYVLDQFARSEIRILFATDVASRGLDIPNVSHVINFDLPETMEDYIHRIGRTGRASKQGVALTFVD